MRESLAELVRPLDKAIQELWKTLGAGDHGRALEHTRAIMSASSKLYTRLNVLAEFARDAEFLADAVGHAPHPASTSPGPIPGDQPLPFPETEGKARGKGGSPKRPPKSRA